MTDPLAALRAFAARLAHEPWFAACGEPLSNDDILEAEALLAALGLDGTAIAGVASWPEAAALA